MSEFKLNVHDALIVVDVQNDFCPGGALAVPDGDAVVPVINGLIARFPSVVASQDWHPRRHTSFASMHPGRDPFESIDVAYGAQTLWPDHCVQGTPGAEFHPELDTAAFELIVRKGFRREVDSYSAFVENDRVTHTGLEGYLRTRALNRVFLCGLAGDVCVYFSALGARETGFETVFVDDACRDLDVDGSSAAARADMAAKGIAIATAAEIVG